MADDNDDNDTAICCNEEQSAFLLLYIVYFVLILLVSDSIIAKPLRLLATAIHEISHAAVCWLTCGRVLKLAVYENASGVTYYRGGWQGLIAAAGYLGEAFWGMVGTICSGGRRTATAAASLLVVALLLTLCYSPNRVLVILCVVYIVITVALIVVEWYVITPLLMYFTLFVGVFLGVCAVTDITGHLILNSRPGSDSYAAYEESGRCCPPRCVGVMWLLMAIFMQIFGIVLAIKLMSDECQDRGWFPCVFGTRFEWNDVDWWPDEWDWDLWDNK